jgi:hypothetical protein
VKSHNALTGSCQDFAKKFPKPYALAVASLTSEKALNLPPDDTTESTPVSLAVTLMDCMGPAKLMEPQKVHITG